MSWPRSLAIAIALVTTTTIVAGAAFTVVYGSAAREIALFVLAAVTGLVPTAVGLLVARRRPDNPVAAVLCWIGLLPPGMAVLDLYALAIQRGPEGPPQPPSAVVGLVEVSWVWLFVPIALLMLLFPDGRTPGPRWRWVAGMLLGVPVALHALGLMSGSLDYEPPFEHVEPVFDILPASVVGTATDILLFVLLGLLIAAAVSMRVRYRRSDELQRVQLKWLALAAFLLPGTLLLGWLSELLIDSSYIVIIGLVAMYIAVPAATAIAILRHNLYDVDRALSAAVTYTAVTAGLLAIFTLAAFAGGVLLGQGSTVAAAGATALSAVALAPLRTRLQRRVDRRLYPMRRAALAAVEDLRMRTYAGRSRPEQLEEVLRVALRDPALRVGYLVPGTDGFVDAAGARVQAVRPVPVRLGGQEIGALVSAGPASRELLREVGGAAALLVEVVRLRLEVSDALSEVESSRARLLHIGYQERRRLERDLHDGAQQRLVSLGMALRLAQRHLDDGSTDVDGLLDQSVAELSTAVAELRQIAHGLRPSSLDDGLGPALAAMTTTVPVQVELDVVAADDLPDDVVTTAYFVASEAVANAVKHAEADRIDLRVAHDGGQLCVQVSDDGCGGAVTRPGSGLAGLTDRVAALGGRLAVRSANGHGTIVEAVLPCAS